jgi:hypothetical protein
MARIILIWISEGYFRKDLCCNYVCSVGGGRGRAEGEREEGMGGLTKNERKVELQSTYFY